MRTGSISPNTIVMCINEPDTSILRTVLLGPKVSGIDRFDCITDLLCSWNDSIKSLVPYSGYKNKTGHTSEVLSSSNLTEPVGA